ncbi:MAG: DEAD/DEAH box helicase [Marinifilaceae bacterium]
MFLKRLHKPLEEAIDESTLEVPTDVQKKCIPQMKSGQDVLCIDDKGTGKSTALVIAVIHKLKEAVADVPRAMIIVPDAEKGAELEEMFTLYGKYTNLRIHSAYEVRLIEDQRDKIYFGTDIVIGTAKQINTLYRISGINITGMQLFALDDAHRVIRDANQSLIERLFEVLPKCQRVIVSDEYNTKIARIEDQHMSIFL